MSPRGYARTPEQLALAYERSVKRQKVQNPQTPQGRFLPREWIQLQNTHSAERSVKIMTWNLLAQCLVRRSLFPTSTCLKAGQREQMLHSEILSHRADIICLQESVTMEVDRTEKLLPHLASAGYNNRYASGHGKNHGCLVAWTSEKYSKIDESVIYYDEQDVRVAENETARRGSSFKTNNIGLLVALGLSQDASCGFIVATTHLFWHPGYTYERARQAGILIREVIKFRDMNGWSHWPCIIAGDFNAMPDDPTYSLLVGESLTAQQELRLVQSRFVNRSIDPSIPLFSEPQGADEEGGDPDRVATNVRAAIPADGLLSTDELVQLHSRGSVLRSAYDEGQRTYRSSSVELKTFGDGAQVSHTRLGACEPQWTSYTHYWKSVLDYIFFIDPPSQRGFVQAFMKPHRAEDMEPGLPKTNVCGSDHVSLSAELAWKHI